MVVILFVFAEELINVSCGVGTQLDGFAHVGTGGIILTKFFNDYEVLKLQYINKENQIQNIQIDFK